MATKVTINDNGSIKLEGEIELYDASGAKFDVAGRTKVSLCRCGASQNKPFCDGAHAKCGFESKVVAVTLPPPKA